MIRRPLLLAGLALLTFAAPAQADRFSQSERFRASDGVTLETTLNGEAPLAPRPTVVEFSPYGRGSGTLDVGDDYNHLLVQIRGTGDSDGSFDALGPRTQSDVAEVLRWACDQSWSDGRLAINGFSASAITIYNSLHLKLPCVKAAILKSGTHELYRDLLYPGGVSNLIPGAGVLALIGAPSLAQGLDRLARNPASGAEVALGLIGAGLTYLQHPTLDQWWRERGMRGDVNHLPILMIDGFYDVESRGAFEGYRALKRDGAHLIVIGAHDGAPQGTDAGFGEAKAWLDHYVRGVANGVQRHPRVQLWMADGDREDLLAGHYVRRDGSDWPIPGTRWVPLSLSPARSGSADSINDGSLGLSAPKRVTDQTYPSLPSFPANTDPPNTAIIGGFGVNPLADAIPALTETDLAEPLGLSYTTPALSRNVVSAGPASLEVHLSTTPSQSIIWALVVDVAPDGTGHPIAAGRLLTAFPHVDGAKSLRDPRSGAIVEPYGRYDTQEPAAIGQSRRYRVEFWPIGNRFKKGHRIRLDIFGASAASKPEVPGLNTIATGGAHPSRLLFPVLPGSDLRAALRKR